MARNFAEIFIKLGLDPSDFQKGIKGASGQISKFSSTFNKDFISGLNKGSATTKDFGQQLLVAGDKAGIGTSQMAKMAGATGYFTDKQILAGKASANMANKAQLLSQAVKDGTMTTREAGRAFAEYGKTQEVVGDKVANFGASLLKTGAMIGGVAAGVAIAGKAIFEFGKSGATVIQTGESFEFLLEKVGAAPDLLDQLRDATLETVDDMTLMQSTLTLTAGAGDDLSKMMMDSAPQLAKIAKAANKLNPALGDTAFMYQSIGTGVKRAQPLILDNLGLTIKVGDANEQFAKSIGKTVEELTAEEKSMAILNATLAAGDTLIAQVGGNVESATDSFAQMETAVANLSDELKAALAPAVADVVGGLAGLIRETREYQESTYTLREAEQLLSEVMGTNIQQKQVYEKLAKQVGKRRLDLADITKILNKELGITADMSVLVRDKTLELAGAFDAERVAGELARYEMGNLAGKQNDLTAASYDAIVAQDLLTLSLKNYNEMMLFNIVSEGLSEEAKYNLAASMGLLDDKTRFMISSTEKLTEKYDLNKDGIIDNEEATHNYVLEIMELIGWIDRIPDKQTKELQFNVVYNTKGEIPHGEGPTARITTPTTPKPKKKVDPTDPRWGAQHGLSFTVPPGYSNDSFFAPLALSSGENVRVTPRGRGRAGRPGKVYNYFRGGDNVYIERSAAAAFLVEKQHQAEFEEIDSVI